MSRKALLFLLIPSPFLALVLAWLGFATLRWNLLGWVLLLVGAGFAIGLPLLFLRQKSAPSAAQEERGDRSFWLILPGFLFVFFGPPVEFLILPETLPRSAAMQVGGILLIIAGFALRAWTRLAIRELYSGHVEVQETHRLVQAGPYRYIRHPGYAGFLLMALGLSVGYSSLIGLAAIPLLLLPGLAYRMKVEEKLLNAHFGDEFQQYRAKTWRIIPGLW